MQFLKTLFWVVLAVAVVLFADANWYAVEIRLWGGLVVVIKLPVLLLAFFLIGFLPTLLVHRARIWGLKRRLEPLERSAAPVVQTGPAPAAAAADRRRVFRRDPVDLHRIEFVEALALEQGERCDVVEREAEIGEDQRAAVRLGERRQDLGEQPVRFLVELLEREQGSERGHRRRGVALGRLETAGMGVGGGGVAADQLVDHFPRPLERLARRVRPLGDPAQMAGKEAQPPDPEG